MDFLDDVVYGAKNAASAVSKASKDIVDVSRLRLNASELRGDITKQYEALGRLVYDAKKDGTDVSDMVDECVANIDTMYKRLVEIKEKIATTMNRRRCPSCGAVNTKEAIYCNRCGKRIKNIKLKKKD